MSTIKRFEEIKAWQEARELAKLVYSITAVGAFAKDFGLRDQMRRAAVSVGSNIAEGFARNGNKEFAKFLLIAKGSATEVQSQAYVALDLGYMAQDAFAEIYDKAESCIVLIYRFIKSLRVASVPGERYKTFQTSQTSVPSKPAFTIIEMLVASLLLGMLVTILTMMFNQSSISWRTGVALVEDMDAVRQNVASARDEADNVYVWNGEIHRIVGLWNADGDVRDRAWDVASGIENAAKVNYLDKKISSLTSANVQPKNVSKPFSVGTGDGTGRSVQYIVNVKSAGPDGEFGTYDDIWSYPDEIN